MDNVDAPKPTKTIDSEGAFFFQHRLFHNYATVTHYISGARLEESATRDTKFGLLAYVPTDEKNSLFSPVISN